MSVVPPLTCIECGHPLDGRGAVLSCAGGHEFPVVGGIADCRPPLDTFDVDADRRLAEQLDADADVSFEELLRRYWARRPDVAEQLVERFVRGDLIGGDRAAEVADQIEALLPAPLGPAAVALEVGCGTAALASVLATRTGAVVASDISLAWLVLARGRLRRAGVENVLLVAATADRLPFADGTFDLVAAADVIEHVPDAAAFTRACYRVTRPGGAVWLSTPNRLSLTPEPHVRVWGVGLLPRRAGRRLVRRVRGVAYDDVHTLSLRGLRRTLAPTGGRLHIDTPRIAETVRAGYPPVTRTLIGGYHVARRVPVVRRLLLGVTPLFHAVLVKPPAADGA